MRRFASLAFPRKIRVTDLNESGNLLEVINDMEKGVLT